MTSQNKLQGIRILNTRPKEQSIPLSQAIREAGGISIDFPTLVIEREPSNWLENLPNLTEVHHAIFISANAVDHFYAALKQLGLPWPSTIRTIAIGKATALALTNRDIRVDQTPAIADSDHLLQLSALKDIRNQTILLIKGVGGRMDITRTLLQRGAKLVSLDVYRRALPVVSQQTTHSLWHDTEVDIILFTSQQAMHNLFTLLGQDARAWLCRTPCLVISERLAEAASLLGIQTIVISSYDTLLSTLEHFNKGLIHDKQH